MILMHVSLTCKFNQSIEQVQTASEDHYIHMLLHTYVRRHVIHVHVSMLFFLLFFFVFPQGEEEASFMEYRKELKVLFDNIVQIVR